MRSKVRILTILLSVCLSAQMFAVSPAYALDTALDTEIIEETENMERIEEEIAVQSEVVPMPQDEMDNMEAVSTEDSTEAEPQIQEQSPTGQSLEIPFFVQAPVQLYSSNTHLSLSLGYPDNRFFTGLIWDGSTDYGVEFKQTFNDTDFSVPSGWLWMLEDWRDTYGTTVYYTADGHRTSGGVFGINGQLIANWKTGITNSFFNCEQYMQLNPDIVNGGYNTPAMAWAHWLNHGINEGRRTSYGFNPGQYKEMYGDLAGIYGNNMPSYYQHYGQYGASEGRWGMYLNVNFNANGGSCSTSSIRACYQKPLGSSYTNSNISLPTPTRPGYVFDGWYTAASGGTRYTAGTTCPWWSDVTLYAHWHAGTTPYTVYHYQQNVNGSGYTLASTQNLSGTTDTAVTPARLNYTGFTAPAGQSITINGNGTASVSYYYTRNKYTVTVNGDTGIGNISGAGSYYYGAAVSISATPKSGYTISGATASPSVTNPYSFTMPADNVTVTITSKASTAVYTVRHYKQTVDGNSYSLEQTETFTGNVGGSIPVAVKTYTGFTSPTVKNVTVTADGSAMVDYYYTRNKYTVSVNGTGVSSGAVEEYYYEQAVNLVVNPADGYTTGGVAAVSPDDIAVTQNDNSYSFIMPASDVTLTIHNTLKPVTVSVPKTLIAGDGGHTGFVITADNTAGIISVTVPNEIIFTQAGKDETVKGNVTLSGTDLTPTQHEITGEIVTDGFTAGSWQAKFFIGIHFSL